MAHFIFLFQLIALGFGAVVTTFLVDRVHRAPSPFGRWQLILFLALTATMIVATLDAYTVVNLGSALEWIRWYSAAILVGTAVIQAAFPHLSRARMDRRVSRRFTRFWISTTLLPLAAAGIMLVGNDEGVLLGAIGVAMTPFFGAIIYGLAIARGAPSRLPRWEPWVVLGLLSASAAIELTWIQAHPPEDGWFFFTLPLAYLYASWATWRDRPPELPSAIDVPAALIAETGLTQREAEVATGILRGRSNKELAGDLGLSEHTVRNHIYNLYRKLRIQKRLDLVLLVQKYQSPDA